MVRTRQMAKNSPTTVNKAKNKIIQKNHLEKLLSQMKPCRILLTRIKKVSPEKVDVSKTLITDKQNKTVSLKKINLQEKKIRFNVEKPIRKTKPKVSKTNSKKSTTKNKSEASTSSQGSTKYCTYKEIVDILSLPQLKETIIENHVEDKQPKEQIKGNYETNIGKVQTRLPKRSKRTQEKTILKRKSSVSNTPKTKKMVIPKTSKDHSDIYEFLSQSTSTELENAIPDEVQKLVKEGKAQVAKRLKFKIKRLDKKKLKTSKQVWHDVLKNLSINNNNNIAIDKMPNKTKKQPEVIETNPSDDFLENDIEVPNEITSKMDITVPRKIISPNKNVSNLAKSLITNKTAKEFGNKKIPQHKNIESKQKLLEMARSFVNHQSTPNNNKTVRIASENIFISPIKCMPPSPWRVQNEKLPQTFHFSRGENHLPSYSSDVIPSSQEVIENNEIKEKLSNKIVSEEPQLSSLNVSKKLVSEPQQLSFLNLSNKIVSEPQQLSSLNLTNKFGSKLSNLSNIENISPISKSYENIKQNRRELDTITRKVLGARNPLKTINVLEVVHLQNWRQTSKENNILNILEKTNLNETKISNLGLHGKMDDKENTSNSINNLFGFNDSAEEQSPIKKPVPNKKTLKTKLRNLKRLLPPKPTRFEYGTVRKIFESPPKQTDIRNVLTSTMNHGESTSKQNFNFKEYTNISTSSKSEVEDENNSEDLRLFDDLDEPQPSFDTTMSRRTYGRFPKRKKRNDFILFSCDSESDSETEKEQKIKKRTKRNKKQEIQHDKELNEFASEFNSMCEEVENYDLIIDSN